MASLNKAILIGNLGADPEVRYTANGDPVATIRLATSESWKDKTTGERKEQTEWHRIVFYSKLAEIVGDYLKKGSSVYIEGRIQTRKWQDQSGQERYTTEIVASEMRMLGSRGDRNTTQGEHGSRGDEASQSQHSNERGASDKQRVPEPVGAMDDDDIPF